MRRLRAWFLRLRGFLRKDLLEHRFAEEIETHLQMHIEDNLRSGMTPTEARRAAVLKLGNVESTRQAYRDRTTLPLLENLAQDLRFAFRQLYKNPGFAATAMLMLALGIGSSVAIFAFVDAALLKPLPYQDPSRIVGVYESEAECPRCNLSYLDYLDWKKNNTVFSSFDVWGYGEYLLKAPAGVEPVIGVRATGGFFRTLGVTPILGRDFDAAGDQTSASNTALLSYSTWQKRFGGRQDVIGQSVTLDDIVYTIIGVLPKTFQFAPRGGAEFWVPLNDPGPCEQRRFCHNLYGIARLKDGVSVQAALADTASIAKQLEMQYPDSNRGHGAAVALLSETIVGDLRPILLVLLGGAGLLLLIATVNIASLLLVRSENRKREIAVRGALGASPSRLIRQFVTEGLVLVTAGSVFGVGLAFVVIQLILKLIPIEMMLSMPYLQGLSLNVHTWVFAAAISLMVLLLFSVTPVLRLPISDLRGDLAEGGRSSGGNLWRRLGSKLVVVELATTVVLLVAAGLLSKSFYRLLNVDLHFQPEHLATLEIAAPAAQYGNDVQAVALERQLVDRISSLPGVQSVGLTTDLPVKCHCNTTVIRIAGHPWHGERNDIAFRVISPGYFKTLQVRLLRGRYFSDADDMSKRDVVIINQALARQFFPGENPIGRKIGDLQLSPQSMREVVGVVDDLQENGLDSEAWPAEYFSLRQEPTNSFAMVVRTKQAEQSLLPALTAVIRQIDPSIGIKNAAAMTQRISDSQTAYLHRISACMVGGFAALALVLSVIGLYGVVAYSVSQRKREIGVRMALGAQRGSVYRLILREAGWLTALGIFVGLGCSMVAATLMRKLLFGVQAWDVPTLAAVAVILAIFAVLASYLPARRAASINPVEALRAE